jgi:S-adenosylmethionine:tRNA ribosyltransferase-isomerase
MHTSEFDYNLPEYLIAQAPIRPRDHSRLLVLNRHTGEIQHQHFFDLPKFLKPGDVLVFNESKVFKARLIGRVNDREIEIFLLRGNEAMWSALARPVKKISPDDLIKFSHGLTARVIKKRDNGIIEIEFNKIGNELMDVIAKIGQVPTPPYIKTPPKHLEDYQTIYAKRTGSVAAPTAGFHFTPELLQKIKKQGVNLEFITLHVGIGTFRPIQSDEIEDHEMHEEFVEIDSPTAERINQAKAEGRRIIAVGTTTVRALEGVAANNQGKLKSFASDVNLFIKPGFDFQIIDGLITNFHLPKSTLLVLVSALAGRENIKQAYQEAIDQKYRFYSFGDAMMII